MSFGLLVINVSWASKHGGAYSSPRGVGLGVIPYPKVIDLACFSIPKSFKIQFSHTLQPCTCAAVVKLISFVPFGINDSCKSCALRP